jgi:hypothetical protein
MLEQLIEISALEWTFLRPGMFALKTVGWWAPQIRAGDVVRWPYLDVSAAPIASTVAEFTGSPAPTFRQWATDNAAQFQP